MSVPSLFFSALFISSYPYVGWCTFREELHFRLFVFYFLLPPLFNPDSDLNRDSDPRYNSDQKSDSNPGSKPYSSSDLDTSFSCNLLYILKCRSRPTDGYMGGMGCGGGGWGGGGGLQLF